MDKRFPLVKVNTLLFDLARVILFNKNRMYKGELNKLHRELAVNEDYEVLE